jgi:xylan 1,4-beta-xylosidase
MLNIQGINKPVFYAYQFLNRLGNIELVNNDQNSWACKDDNGNIQVLAWDYTYTLPDSINNQQYYIRDLPAKNIGKLKVNIDGIPEGKYSLEICKVGYRCNDAYTSYYDLQRPNQLSKIQVEQIKNMNNGSPLASEIVTVVHGASFSKELDIHENDVFLLNLVKL